jgi:transposase InsO family protein
LPHLIEEADGRALIARIVDLQHADACRIHVIQIDNGAEFQSQFHWHAEALDIRHVYIRPGTPPLNGKVERSHRVDDQSVAGNRRSDPAQSGSAAADTGSCSPPPVGVARGERWGARGRSPSPASPCTSNRRF